MKETTLKSCKVQSIKSEIGEVLNAVTHGIGVALAITALVLLTEGRESITPLKSLHLVFMVLLNLVISSIDTLS